METVNIEKFLTVKFDEEEIHLLKNVLKEYISLEERCLSGRCGLLYKNDEGNLRGNELAKNLLNLLEKPYNDFTF